MARDTGSVTTSFGDKTTSPTGSDISRVLVQLAGPLRRGVQRVGRAEASPDDGGVVLPEPQVEVLRLLTSGGPWTTGALAARLDVAPSTLSNVLRDLESAGLATRTRVPDDQRLVDVRAQQAGLDALATQERRAAGAVEACVRTLEEADRQALRAALPALARLVDALGAAR